MHTDADFLAAVAAHPHDQLTRLVYADWLDEQGDPRGELVCIEEEVRFEPTWWSQPFGLRAAASHPSTPRNTSASVSISASVV